MYFKQSLQILNYNFLRTFHPPIYMAFPLNYNMSNPTKSSITFCYPNWKECLKLMKSINHL